MSHILPNIVLLRGDLTIATTAATMTTRCDFGFISISLKLFRFPCYHFFFSFSPNGFHADCVLKAPRSPSNGGDEARLFLSYFIALLLFFRLILRSYLFVFNKRLVLVSYIALSLLLFLVALVIFYHSHSFSFIFRQFFSNLRNFF